MHLAPFAVGQFASITIGYLCSAPLGVPLERSPLGRKSTPTWGEGRTILESCAIPDDAPGVVTSATPNRGFAKDVIDALSWHLEDARAFAVGRRTRHAPLHVPHHEGRR